jgi:5-methylcytosine-specific restriction protein A
MPALSFEDDETYLAWQQSNPRKFVLNANRSFTQRSCMIHLASCWHLDGEYAFGALTRRGYYKVGARTIDELRMWLRQQRRDVEAKLCATCKPELATPEPDETSFPDEVPPSDVHTNAVLLEGAVRQIFVNAYERNAVARDACIALHGVKCSVPSCGFDFGAIYGEHGRGYIHVHHLRPLSQVGEEYVIDPDNDLRPVCPNCHAMLHARGGLLSIEELDTLIRAARAARSVQR